MSQINFNSTPYTRDGLYNLKGRDIVALHNALAKKAKVSETKRFSSIGAGIERTWKLLEQVGEKPAAKAADKPKTNGNGATGPTASLGAAPSAPKKVAKKAAGERARRGTNLLPPGHAPLACREGSKQAMLVDKLSRANGATMNELLDALQFGNKPWTEATVRSGFGWDLKQKGYGVRSEFTPSTGTERFYLVLPTIKGHEAAIPAHTPLKGKPKADARQAKLKV